MNSYKDVDLALALALALARMEADPRLVTKFLDRQKAAKKGLTGGSWNSIAYRVKKAMRLIGAGPRIDIKGRPIADQRYYKLPVVPYQAALGTFMRWEEAEDIPLEKTTSRCSRNSASGCTASRKCAHARATRCSRQ